MEPKRKNIFSIPNLQSNLESIKDFEKSGEVNKSSKMLKDSKTFRPGVLHHITS